MPITKEDREYLEELANDAVQKVREKGYEDGYAACYEEYRSVIEAYQKNDRENIKITCIKCLHLYSYKNILCPSCGVSR